MRKTVIAVAVLLALAAAATAQEKQQAVKSKSGAPPLEAKVRKLWEDFKNKDKAGLAAALDDGFRQFEEGLSAFGDKKAEINAVDEFELVSYTLSDFTVKALGPNSALVTYIARYEGKSGGEATKGNSVFGEVWTRTGNEWKALYMQETYIR
jgi:hypothetical protein